MTTPYSSKFNTSSKNYDRDLRRPDRDLHRPDRDLHRPDRDLHRPDRDLHRPDRDLRRPDRDLHRPDLDLHRPRPHYCALNMPDCIAPSRKILPLNFVVTRLQAMDIFNRIRDFLDSYGRDLKYDAYNIDTHFIVDFGANKQRCNVIIRVWDVSERSHMYIVEFDEKNDSDSSLTLSMFWALKDTIMPPEYAVEPRGIPKCPHCINLNRGLTYRKYPIDHWVRESPDPASAITCPVLLSTTCSFCKQTGHTKSRCDKLASAATIECNFCKERGHRIRDCPALAESVCRFCKQKGHTIARCQQLVDKKMRDQDEVDADVCKYCKENGHMVRECPALQLKKMRENEEPTVALRKPNQFDLDTFMSDESERMRVRPCSPDSTPPPFANHACHFRPTSPELPPPPSMHQRSTTPELPPPPSMHQRSTTPELPPPPSMHQRSTTPELPPPPSNTFVPIVDNEDW